MYKKNSELLKTSKLRIPRWFWFYIRKKLEAISYGVIKMNIDTDLQFAYTEGIRDYMNSNIEYLRTQIGNPEGEKKTKQKNSMTQEFGLEKVKKLSLIDW